MTAAQEAAFDQIEEIMREHFDAGAFCVLADLEPESNGREEIRSGWHGGRTRAVGLFLYGADGVRAIRDKEL